MKNTNIKSGANRRFSWRAVALAAMGIFAIAGMTAQNSLPAPGSGGSFKPAPIGGGNSGRPNGGGPGFRPGPGFGPGPGWGNNGIGWNPGPGWGGPNPGWNPAPSFMNQGTTNVIACGYDARGVWRTIPLYVSYTYTGFEYDVTVINAWNPWTQSWNMGVDMPAYNTSYYINGQTYDFYAPLTTGTYYFNL